MATSKGTKRKRESSYITGEKEINRVRLFSRSRDGMLWLEWRDENKAKRCAPLHHNDVQRGKIAANEVAADLLRNEGPRSGEITLKTLFDNYEREVTPTKSPASQKHDKRAMKLFLSCWGNATVKNFDRRDWDRFIKERRAGTLKLDGDWRTKKGIKGVRDRAIEHDLKLLLAVCNWAETVRVKGEPMLGRNPFKGFPLPAEANPRRPIVTHAEYSKLTEAAKKEGPEVALYLLLNHETGHRCSAVGHLRWSDVDTDNALVTWRASYDKQGREHTTPLTAVAAEALKVARKQAARIGDGWVFPSPIDPEKPTSREFWCMTWRRLEAAGEVERIPGRGWHSLRRKFATDLKADTPLADLCSLGGWKDHNTVLKC